jgi:hypothetical protein
MRTYLALLFCFFFYYTKACECPPVEPFTKKSADNYDVIFYGKVDSIVPCSSAGIGTAYFTISNLYKGSAEKYVSFDYDCTSSCMMSFAKDEEWIIYSTYLKFDLLTVNLCSHSRKRITDGSADFYQVSSGKTFDQENDFLKNTFGIQEYSVHNELNDQQKVFQPHNVQPSPISKLWLLIISLLVMAVVYLISKKFFKNGK